MPVLQIDALIVLGAILALFGAIGWRRGPKAEAITLAAVIFPTLLLGNGITRNQILDLFARAIGAIAGLGIGERGALILAPAQRSMLALLLLIGAIVVAHALGGLGQRYGVALDHGQRAIGVGFGLVTGLLIAVTGFALGRSGVANAAPLRIALPTIEIALPAERDALIQAAPVVFAGAFFLVAALAWRQARRRS